MIGLRFFTVYGPWGRPDMAYFSFSNDILSGWLLLFCCRLCDVLVVFDAVSVRLGSRVCQARRFKFSTTAKCLATLRTLTTLLTASLPRCCVRRRCTLRFVPPRQNVDSKKNCAPRTDLQSGQQQAARRARAGASCVSTFVGVWVFGRRRPRPTPLRSSRWKVISTPWRSRILPNRPRSERGAALDPISCTERCVDRATCSRRLPTSAKPVRGCPSSLLSTGLTASILQRICSATRRARRSRKV